MNALCLTIDGLSPAYLGCYGNGWARTPAIDGLAAESIVFDQAIVDGTRLDQLAASWWQGRHAAVNRPPAASGFLLPRALAQAGVASCLVTDEPELASHPLAAAFTECVEVPAVDAETLAASEDETQFARCFAALHDVLAAKRGPQLIWAHFRGLRAAWDAPYEFREQFADEQDPPPGRFAEPPHFRLAADADPDELLGIRQAYAGQVALLDGWLDLLKAALADRNDAEQTMLLIQGARGYPLGIHGAVGFPEGPDSAALFGELVHVPLVVRLPGGVGAACRTGALVQPPDIAASLAAWFAVPFDETPVAAGKSLLKLIRGEADALRDRAVIVTTRGERALRTSAWHLRQPAAADDEPSPPVELYAKPDDRHEINEISALRPTEAQSLQLAMDAWRAAAASDGAAQPPPLDAALTTAFHD